MMLCEDKQHHMQKAAAFVNHLATLSLCFGIYIPYEARKADTKTLKLQNRDALNYSIQKPRLHIETSKPLSFKMH